MNKVGIWIALGIGAVVLIVVIMKSKTPQPAMATTSSQGFGALGSFLGGILSSSAAPRKVSAPTANPNFSSPGSSGDPAGFNNYSASQGAQYSAAMASTGEVASANAGSGGTTFGGGTSDPLGIGTLQNPGFDTGPMGANFSTGN